MISVYPGISYKELKKIMGIEKASFSYNLQKLKEMKLIWRVRSSDGNGYEIVIREKMSKEMFITLMERYIEGEIDKETMLDILDDLEEFESE